MIMLNSIFYQYMSTIVSVDSDALNALKDAPVSEWVLALPAWPGWLRWLPGISAPYTRG